MNKGGQEKDAKWKFSVLNTLCEFDIFAVHTCSPMHTQTHMYIYIYIVVHWSFACTTCISIILPLLLPISRRSTPDAFTVYTTASRLLSIIFYRAHWNLATSFQSFLSAPHAFVAPVHLCKHLKIQKPTRIPFSPSRSIHFYTIVYLSICR